MRISALLGGVLALLLLATPVSAHHKPGHQGGPPGQRGVNRDDDAGPLSGPGNSGAAHWCKDNYAAEGFKNHGQCVSFFARGGTLDIDDDDSARLGDLEITEVRIDVDDDEGTFFLRGVGAEGRVFALIDGGSGQVVGGGVSDVDADGSWVVEGTWACNSDSPQAARFRVFDADERDRLLTTFPCDELDD
jgi:hypothetical protein